MWMSRLPAARVQIWFLRSGHAMVGRLVTTTHQSFVSQGLSKRSRGWGPGRIVPAVAVPASALYVSFVRTTENAFIFLAPSFSYSTSVNGLDVSSVLRSKRKMESTV